VVTASDDKTARVWEADTGRPVGDPLRHKAMVRSAGFSPDGQRVVTASDDKTARVWEADTGRPLGAPLKCGTPVWSAAFSPDGRRVLTSCNHKTALVWRVLLGCCASQAEADRLASLAEAVSGYEVSDTGSLSFIGLDEQRRRLQELGRLSGTGSVPEFSVDWIIRRFTRK
jgi:WD40 repeat protein